MVKSRGATTISKPNFYYIYMIWYDMIWYDIYILLDIFQQFTFVIKQNEQYTDLIISNNTNRYDRQKKNIIYKKKFANN